MNRISLIKPVASFLLFIGLIGSSFQLSAQEAKRYLLLEHFTNTRCGICSFRNPAFYETIAEHLPDIHHISYHPEIPYNDCVLYLHNPAQNTHRKNVYNVPGTPWMQLWGKKVNNSSTLLPENALQQALSQTSPWEILVSEELAGAGRSVNIEVKSVGAVSDTGDIRLFADVVEKTVNYNAPNGENEHHDVFRLMLPDSEGEMFQPAAEGGSMNFTYQYDFNPDWDLTQIYVIAFVQEMNSLAVYNSGSSLDPDVSTSRNEALDPSIAVFPNPATDQLIIHWGDAQQPDQLQLLSPLGQVVADVPLHQLGSNETSLSVAEFPAGLYTLLLVQGDRLGHRSVLIR
ncbi:MAG: Omp28-related outer membrane protein [Bacteroidota bacterium]